MKGKRILVTGSKSGLGRYITRETGAVEWHRQTTPDQIAQIEEKGVDVIIHCAFNSSRDIPAEKLAGYVEDNLLFTARLLRIPHRHFIYLSSIEVYPKNGQLHFEEETVDIQKLENMYSIAKLMAESLISARAVIRPLILRCSVLLGPSMRPNSLVRILDEPSTRLTLSGDSSFNYVRYEDLLAFMEFAVEKQITGILNAVSQDNITLNEIAQWTGAKVQFGSFRYETGRIEARKIAALFPPFVRTSRQVVAKFMEERKQYAS